MAIDRTTLKIGPGRVELGTGPAVFYSQGAIEITAESETLPTETDKWGKVDEVLGEPVYKISFTPVGEWENLTSLFPFKAMAHGAGLFTGTDVQLKVIGSDGEQFLFKSVAVTKEPELFFGAEGTLFGGPVEFTALRTNAAAWSVADSIVAISSVTPPADTEFSLPTRQSYTGAWTGKTGFTAMDSEAGFRVRTAVSLAPQKTDNCGIVNFILTDYQVSCAARPIGPTSTQVIANMGHQGSGNFRGRSLNAISAALNISATGVYCRVYGAALKSGRALFSSQELRGGELEWVATKAAASDALLYLGTSAPA